MMNPILIVYLLLVVAPIGMIIHECGHAFGAKIIRANRITLTIGLGKQLFTFMLSNICVKIHAIYFMGGFTKTNRHTSYTNKDVFWITIFGPLNNALFAVIFFYLNVVFINPYIRLLFLFNLWLAVINLIPFKFKGKQSDGYILLDSLHNKD